MPEMYDPLGEAAGRLFGLSYLFPYQRLVTANILEAAEAAGLALNWPEGTTAADRADEIPLLPLDDSGGEVISDRFSSGRQLVILPTGAGKSLCFQLPAMIIEGPTLVIYPILSLMADQKRRLEERGFSPVVLRGGQEAEEREAIWNKIEKGESKCIIANPEVLLTPPVIRRFENIKISHIVIDEAHCVSEWGESFRPSYLEIGSIINRINPPLVTAFTATASAPVLEKIKKYIFNSDDVNAIVGNPDRPNISYAARGCICRDLAVRDLLITHARPAIVFCSSRTGAENLVRVLRTGLGEMGADWHNEIRFYHAGLEREEKTLTEQWFMGNSRAVLCATCAYGMGVDKADVRTVIHRDCPPSVEAYLQEAGRAGRDGMQSKAILLWGPDDENSLRRAKTEAARVRISALLDYARDAGMCRRTSLLRLLNYDNGGESPETMCCDVCEGQADTVHREEAAVLDFVRKHKRRYTADEAAAVMSRNYMWTQAEAGEVVNYLCEKSVLKKANNIIWKGALTVVKKRRK